MANITLNVQGMSCGHCVKAVEGAVNELGATGKVDLAGGSVAVQFDESRLTPAQIKAAIEDQGYDVV